MLVNVLNYVESPAKKKQTLSVAILKRRSPIFSYDGDTPIIVGSLHPWPFESGVLVGNAVFESNSHVRDALTV